MEPKIEVTDYVNVVERAKSLGVQIPGKIALLPRNFHNAETKDELVHENETATVRKLFRMGNIDETPIEFPNEKIPEISEKSYGDWIAPILFFSFSALSNNPLLVDLSLNIISAYITELFKGLSANRGVNLNIVVERKNGLYKNISYQGPVKGLDSLGDIVEKVGMDEYKGR